MTNFIPMNDHILVLAQVEDNVTQTESGLYIATEQKTKFPIKGEVLAVSEEVKDLFNVGETVMFYFGHGEPLTEKQTHLVLKKENVLGKVINN